MRPPRTPGPTPGPVGFAGWVKQSHIGIAVTPGVRCTAGQAVMTSGSQQALDMCSPGHRDEVWLDGANGAGLGA